MPKNYSDKSQSKLGEMFIFSAAWKPKTQSIYHKKNPKTHWNKQKKPNKTNKQTNQPQTKTVKRKCTAARILKINLYGC